MCTRSASGSHTGGTFCARHPACSRKHGGVGHGPRDAGQHQHHATAHRARCRARNSCRAAAAASSGARVSAAWPSGPAAGVKKYPPDVRFQPRKRRSAAAAATSASMGSRMHPAPGTPRVLYTPHTSPTVSIRSTSLRGRYTLLTSLCASWQNSSAESRLTCRVRGGSQTWIIWFPPFFFSMHPAYRTGGENRRETGPLFLFYRSSVTSSLST